MRIKSFTIIKVSNATNWLILIVTLTLFLLACEAFTRLSYKDEFIYTTYRANITEGLFTYVIADVYISIKDGQKIPALSFNDDRTNFTEISDYKIAVIGDSFTQGIGPHPEVYPKQLEIMLNHASAKNFEVLNFGQSGYNTVQELTLLKEFVVNNNHDLVILQFFINDVEPVGLGLANGVRLIVEPDEKFIVIGNSIVPSFPFLTLEENNVILKNSKFLRFVASKSFNIKKKIWQGKCAKDSNKCNWDALNEIANILRERNIRFVIINIPGAEKPKSFCSEFQHLYTQLRESAKELNVYYLDLCDYMQTYDSKEFVADNLSHYTKEGHKVIAGILFENLTKEGIIPYP